MFDDKKFQNNDSQEIITVNGENGVFFSLSNGSNIKKDVFFQKYTEVVDTSNFFNSSSLINELAGKINQIDPSKVPEVGGGTVIRDLAREPISEPSTERNVIQQPEMGREEMIRKFQEEQSRKDLSQYKVYDDDEQAMADFESKVQRPPEPPVRKRMQNPDGFSEDGCPG